MSRLMPGVIDCVDAAISVQRRRRANMMQMTDMPIAMMWGMGLIWLLVIIFLLLGIAAFIKYLRS
jgi:hypothetical protein